MERPTEVTAAIHQLWQGHKKMVVFDDTAPINEKLMLYPHEISWQGGIPIPEKKDGSCIDLSKDWVEPLVGEGQAFINAINGQQALTDAEEGLRVLKVLPEKNLLLLKGCVPGHNNSYLTIEK